MIAVLLAIVMSMLLAGIVWLLIGSRLSLQTDPDQNDILNLAVYAGLLLVPCMAVVLVFIA